MPELPQIEPQGEVKPAGVAPRVESPLPEAVEKAGQATTDKALAVHKQLVDINRYSQFHQADAEMVLGQTQIEKQSRTLQDPEARVAFVQKGNEDLIKTLTSKYPHAGIELGPQLQTRAAENVKQAFDASIVLAHGNAMDNLDTNQKTTTDAFSTALDDRDAQHLLSNGHQLIDKYLSSGAIGLGEAAKRHYALEYNSHLAAYNHVADIDAVKAMDTPIEDLRWKSSYNGQEMGINAVDYLTVQSRAQRQENRKNGIAEDEMKQKMNAVNMGILTHSISDADFQVASKHGLVTAQMYQYREGHKPFDPDALAQTMTEISARVNRGPEEWDHFKADYIANIAPYRDPKTNSAAIAEITARREDSATELGKVKGDLEQQGYDALNNRYGDDIYGPHPDMDLRLKVLSQKNQYKNALKAAKNDEEAQKVHDDFMKRITEGAPPAAAARIATGKKDPPALLTKKVGALSDPPGFKK